MRDGRERRRLVVSDQPDGDCRSERLGDDVDERARPLACSDRPLEDLTEPGQQLGIGRRPVGQDL